MVGELHRHFPRSQCYLGSISTGLFLVVDVATDAAKQEKFMEGLNDELSMHLMVAIFTN